MESKNIYEAVEPWYVKYPRKLLGKKAVRYSVASATAASLIIGGGAMALDDDRAFEHELSASSDLSESDTKMQNRIEEFREAPAIQVSEVSAEQKVNVQGIKYEADYILKADLLVGEFEKDFLPDCDGNLQTVGEVEATYTLPPEAITSAKQKGDSLIIKVDGSQLETDADWAAQPITKPYTLNEDGTANFDNRKTSCQETMETAASALAADGVIKIPKTPIEFPVGFGFEAFNNKLSDMNDSTKRTIEDAALNAYVESCDPLLADKNKQAIKTAVKEMAKAVGVDENIKTKVKVSNLGNGEYKSRDIENYSNESGDLKFRADTGVNTKDWNPEITCETSDMQYKAYKGN